jgi:hypothetical protein
VELAEIVTSSASERERAARVCYRLLRPFGPEWSGDRIYAYMVGNIRDALYMKYIHIRVTCIDDGDGVREKPEGRSENPKEQIALFDTKIRK